MVTFYNNVPRVDDQGNILEIQDGCLAYFNNIVPCGIPDKQVTSLQKELGRAVPMQEVKEVVKQNFEQIFGATLKD